jgi:hypothetical protein
MLGCCRKDTTGNDRGIRHFLAVKKNSWGCALKVMHAVDAGTLFVGKKFL